MIRNRATWVGGLVHGAKMKEKEREKETNDTDLTVPITTRHPCFNVDLAESRCAELHRGHLEDAEVESKLGVEVDLRLDKFVVHVETVFLGGISKQLHF